MTAIFGVIALTEAPVERAALERMEAALGAFGSTGGVWHDGRAAHGQRFQPFTPEDARERQPARSADGDLVLVADGRLDNRPEIIRALGLPGGNGCARLRAAARGRTALGTDCLKRLVGEFTLAVWSCGAGRLLLGCSAPLARPVYHWSDGRVFAFLYLDVARLPAGERLVAGPGASRVERWWQPDLSRRLTLAHDRDYVEALEEALGLAVDAQLRRSGPAGAMVSGGLDSSAVVAFATPRLAAAGGRLRAYTEVPPPGFDGPVPPGRYAAVGLSFTVAELQRPRPGLGTSDGALPGRVSAPAGGATLLRLTCPRSAGPALGQRIGHDAHDAVTGRLHTCEGRSSHSRRRPVKHRSTKPEVQSEMPRPCSTQAIAALYLRGPART